MKELDVEAASCVKLEVPFRFHIESMRKERLKLDVDVAGRKDGRSGFSGPGPSIGEPWNRIIYISTSTYSAE